MNRSYDFLARADSNSIVTRRRVFCCPNCQAELVLPVAIVLEHPVLAEPNPSEQHEDDWKAHLLPDERQLLDRAEAGGLLTAFKAAVDARDNVAPVRNIDRFFVTWMRAVQLKRIPPFALQHFIEAFGGVIAVWAAQGVAVILSDNQVRQFCPLHLMSGAPIKGVTQNRTIRGRAEADPELLVKWTKTRFGYVAGEGAYFSEMRKRSFGEFANVKL